MKGKKDPAININKLKAAYRATRYVVAARPAFVLRCGRPSTRLRALLRDHGAATACVISAANPRSVRRSAAVNRAAHAHLARTLRRLGLPRLPGRAVDPAGLWPTEAFFLVLGLERRAALRLARRYGQNAVLWAGPSGRPRLLWT